MSSTSSTLSSSIALVASASTTSASTSAGPAIPKVLGTYGRFPLKLRPHRNPLADENVSNIPCSPDHVDWFALYPFFSTDRNTFRGVEILDIGCAWGGGVLALSNVFPDKIILGMEIRARVAQYSQERVNRLRRGDPDEFTRKWLQRLGLDSLDQRAPIPLYENVNIIQGNAMKFLPFYFRRGQIERMSFCFADPHFKNKTHRRRIINSALLPEYAYIMKEGGLLYVITDVKNLYDWMIEHLDASNQFERLKEEELDGDQMLSTIKIASEDAQRTLEKGLPMYFAVYRRVLGPAEKVWNEMRSESQDDKAELCSVDE